MLNNPVQNLQMAYLPPQQVLQVDGKASIEKMRMAPNSTLLAIDRNAPIIWFCSSDGFGNVTGTPFDYTRHEEEPELTMATLQSQLDELKSSVSQILEVIKDGNKSNTRYVKPANHDNAE